jgi:hypothetical protein
MRLRILVLVALVASMGAGAYAELQNVEVGGSIRIRGNMFKWDEDSGPGFLFWQGRSFGDRWRDMRRGKFAFFDNFDGTRVIGPGNVIQSTINRPIWGNFLGRDNRLNDNSFVEQRTRLNIKADFTDEVSAFIELDSYDIWGEDFRSQNYVLGVDGRQNGIDDVEMYQAYIEASEMYGAPLRLRVGRQELSFGSEWLVGVNNTSSRFGGLSFDAIRSTYATDMFSVDAFAAKIVERMGDFGDNDADFYGIYASYLGFEDITIDAYWMFLRDDVSVIGTDKSDLHTIGLRGAGTLGAFDFEAEAAYQFGSIDDRGLGWLADFWTPELDWNAFGGNVELGYTFDMSYQPRVYAGAAYMQGADQEDNVGWFQIFRGGKTTDLAFNRLFSNWEYSEFLENTELSNAFVYRLGGSIMPTESVKLTLAATYIMADEVDSGRFLFWSWEDSDDVGLELGLYADYNYTEDLVFRAGYAHFFADDGLRDGADILWNGLGEMYTAGNSADFDYLFVETEIAF